MSSRLSDLVQAAARGDQEAFGVLVTMYQEIVYAVALGIVADFHAAQDVAQEVFITAYRKLGTLRGPEKFPAWLRKIAVNAAKMRNRRLRAQRLVREEQAHQLGAPQELTGGNKALLHEPLEPDDFEQGLMEILGSLSEKKRVPVLLCYMEAASRKEAAKFLGIREATLRKRLHDAKVQLQREIVSLAERTLKEHRLPRDFAERCICGCKKEGGEKHEKREAKEIKRDS